MGDEEEILHTLDPLTDDVIRRAMKEFNRRGQTRHASPIIPTKDEQLGQLEAERDRWRKLAEERERELTKLRSDYSWLNDQFQYTKNSFSINSKGQIGSELLNRLIRFCHPDRHRGSAQANELTAELLRLRDQHEKGQR